MKNPHRQTWKGSAAEAVFNVALGFGVAFAAWEWLLRPMINAEVLSVEDSFWITLIFTAISLARTFVVRRVATWLADRRAGCSP